MLSRQEVNTMRHLANAQYWDRPAGGNTGRLFLAFGGPVCADRISNCPLDRVLTYKNLIYLLNLQFCVSTGQDIHKLCICQVAHHTSCLDSVTSSHLFHLAHVLCRQIILSAQSLNICGLQVCNFFLLLWILVTV